METTIPLRLGLPTLATQICSTALDASLCASSPSPGPGHLESAAISLVCGSQN